ncbi:MAG: hypothetical protein LC737_10775, partial [Chloroflexi bacterium]|nr:hypothetical protein [Chloroflexota bacterium]
IVLAFVLSIPMVLNHSPALGILPYLTIPTIGTLSLYATASWQSSRSLLRFAASLVLLVLLGTGMSFNNGRAAIEALLGIGSVFRRTPKFDLRSRADCWHRSHYSLPHDPIVWIEITAALAALAVFALGQIWPAWRVSQWLLIYALGYGFVAGISLWQAFAREWLTRVRQSVLMRLPVQDAPVAE